MIINIGFRGLKGNSDHQDQMESKKMTDGIFLIHLNQILIILIDGLNKNYITRTPTLTLQMLVPS